MTLETCHHTRVEISPHALQRFRDRASLVFPGGLDTDSKAGALLAIKVRRAGIRKRRPGWTHPTGNLTHRHATEGYIVIAEAVAFPIQRIDGRLTATTCLVRGWSARSRRPA